METSEHAAPCAGSAPDDNPLLQAWHTPHATPPFAHLRNGHFLPALQAAMAAAQDNVRHIVECREAPTFGNTIVALEQSDELLERITGVLFNLDECHTNEELGDIVMQTTPLLTRFENSVWMDGALFARVQAVYRQYFHEEHGGAATATGGLSPEEAMLTYDTYQSFVRNGVNLSPADQETFRRNSEELARLSVQFNKNVLADNNAFSLHVTDESLLGGLPADVMAAAREEARQRGLEGWCFTLAYPVYGPFMEHADNRSLREQMWRAYNSRGNHGDGHDNGDIIRRMTWLRRQQARLLGYQDYLALRLDRTMAKSAARLDDFVRRLIHAAYPAAQRDLQEVQDWMAARGDATLLQRWDFGYYAEKMKQERYHFDGEQLRPYFPLEKVRQGIFDLYGKLYGLSFEKVHDIEVYHDDVATFEVRDGDRLMGVLYLDMFPRESKRGGAWMTEFRGQRKTTAADGSTTDIRPLIQVVCNFSKPVEGHPALLSFGEVETFMHEMGHAMHGMLSEVTYESLSGTNVYRDFVEMPSQLMENWCREPAFLHTFARHYQTGEALPDALIRGIRASDRYMAGWLCLRQLSLGLIDLSFHTLEQPVEEAIDAFEHKHTIALLPAIAGCCTSTSFTHIFCGGYAAAYYSYKWSEMLDADIYSRFQSAGLFDRANAMRFRREVLSRGGTVEPALLFLTFMGRDPDLQAYLLRDGLLPATDAPQAPGQDAQPV